LTDLQAYNTFGISVSATRFVEISSLEHLQSLYKNEDFNNKQYLILGGGSNILFTKDYEGLILKNNLKGISLVNETENYVWVKVAAGELWHPFVLYCVERNWGGIENLSLIPGTVGAAPIQNIGAYGVELKETFESLEAINMHNGQTETFTNEQCNFGYRESIFKHDLKGEYFISSVTFKLNKKPVLNATYGDIQNLLDSKQIKVPTIKDVSDAVIDIRRSKLPDPAQIGNAGSFFKNPIISKAQFESLKLNHPEIKSFPAPDAKVKIPAAWFIEKAGWKGKRIGDIGVHEKQALVLVNYGGGKGEDILKLAYEIIDSIKTEFNVTLIPEVNIL